MTDQELVSTLIKSFHLTLTYCKIYPPTSQMVSATFDTLYRTAAVLAGSNQSLTFSALSGKLLVDGTEPAARDSMAAGDNILHLFEQRKIQSITIRDGVTREELMDFIYGLLRKNREELPSYPHIALDQTVYVAMVKGEEAIVKITEMLQNTGGDIVNIIKSVRESYDLIDQIPDAAARQKAQDTLAQELAKQDTAVLRDIFERELPRKIEESGLKPKLLSALSQEKIQDIFGEISVWYEDVRKKEGSDFAAVDQLERLKKFMQTVLNAPAARQVPLQFFEELLRKGLLDQLPEWCSGNTGKPATLFEIERLLEKPAAELADPQVKQVLPQLIEKLCQVENTDLIAKTLDKLLENLRNPGSAVRQATAELLAEIYALLQAHAMENLLRYIESPLLEAARTELAAGVHERLLDILRQRCRQNLLYGEYDLAVRILDLFRQHATAPIGNDERLRGNAAAALQKLVPEIIEVLVSDLKSDNEKKRLGSMQILARIAEKAIEPLIRVIRESEDIRARRLAAISLKNLGPAACAAFREQLNLGLSVPEIKRMLEVLGDLGDTEMVEQLNALLHYPDAGLTRDVMRCLAKVNTTQARLLLIEQLKNPDIAIVTDAARLLGELRSEEAVPGLTLLLNDTRCPAALKEELAVVLGTIGNFQAAPVLIKLLSKKPPLFSRGTVDTERLKMRAAWALRKFPTPAVEAALLKAAGDRSKAVAMTAAESLVIVRQRATGESESK
jgi:HEAT repeat protein